MIEGIKKGFAFIPYFPDKLRARQWIRLIKSYTGIKI
jgi:hypothetical protein